MNPNWLGVLSAALALAAFAAAWRCSLAWSVKRKIIATAAATVAAIPGASFAAYYTHKFGDPAWFYQFRSLPGTEPLVVLIGVAGGFCAALLPRILFFVPLFGVAAFSVVPFAKPFIGPLETDDFSDRWSDGICMQSTSSTCGAASSASVLRHFGIIVTEARLAAEAHSYSGGTEAWYLARALRSRGLLVRFESGSGIPPDRCLPAVVGVRLGPVGHFIAIIGREGDRFIVGDPLRGREPLSGDELLERYEFTGFRMVIDRKD